MFRQLAPPAYRQRSPTRQRTKVATSVNHPSHFNSVFNRTKEQHVIWLCPVMAAVQHLGFFSHDDMKRFSLLAIFYTVFGAAGYFAMIVASNTMPGSFVEWIVQSLGFLYGTILYFTGLVAFFVALGTVRKSISAAETVTAIPITLLPALVGVIGAVHGYISVFRALALSRTNLDPTVLYDAHATVLACGMTGLCLTFPSFAMLAIALALRPSQQKAEKWE